METVNLLDLPHRRAKALLATGVPVYLPVNPVEYHGPHLSLHNDRLVSTGLARRIHAELRKTHADWPFVLASDLEVGAEPCRGEGSRVTNYADERKLVLDAVRALVELGAKRIALVTFHGGPLHNLALDAGVRLAERGGVRAIAPLSLVLDTLIELDDPWRFRDAFLPIADEAARERCARRLTEDVHAGFFETSLALAVAFDSVDPSYVELPECPDFPSDRGLAMASELARLAGRERLARELMLGARTSGWGRLDPFPGYTGAPHLASVASGEAFVRYALEMMLPVVTSVFDAGHRAPPPVLEWMERATFGGRFAPQASFSRST